MLLRVGVAVLIMVAGRSLAPQPPLAGAGHQRATLTPSMESLFLSVAYYSVWMLAIMAALIVLGVPAATVVAVVGVAGPIGPGLAAVATRPGGVGQLRVVKPFVVGDLIETKGVIGTVEGIRLFTTTLVRWDNRVIILPNAEIQQTGASTSPGSRCCARNWSSASATTTTSPRRGG